MQYSQPGIRAYLASQGTLEPREVRLGAAAAETRHARLRSVNGFLLRAFKARVVVAGRYEVLYLR